MKAPGNLVDATEQELVRWLDKSVRYDRTNVARMPRLLAEIDRRKLAEKLGYPSLFALCTERFHMSEAVAAKRIRAARTAGKFPMVFDLVAEGAVHLSAIHLLSSHLTEDNHRDVLARARHKTMRQLEELVAELAPKPDVPARIRRLPQLETARAARSDDEVFSPAKRSVPSEPPSSAGPIAARSEKLLGDVRPLAPARYKLSVTLGQEGHDTLRQLQDLMAHQVPSGDPAAIVEKALEALLDKTLKTKVAKTDRPRTSRTTDQGTQGSSRNRSIPGPVKRAVWRRDRGQCAYRAPTGKVCRETRQLEFHHVVPFALGGNHTPEHLELRCRAHNQFQADLDFGIEAMNRHRGHRPQGR